MSKQQHCGWCGRFVPADTPPTVGLNYYGRPVGQILCAEDRRSWCQMAALNVVMARPS